LWGSSQPYLLKKVNSHHVPILKYPCLPKVEYKWLKASPPMLSMWFQTVKFIVTMWKCACLAPEIDFSASNLCSLPCLVKGATQLCTSKKQCNKLDLTAALLIAVYKQIGTIWLVNHSAWSTCLLLVVPQICSSNYSFIGGVAKKKSAKLKRLILLSKVTYWARWRCSKKPLRHMGR
jgi:hypothetical protein